MKRKRESVRKRKNNKPNVTISKRIVLKIVGASVWWMPINNFCRCVYFFFLLHFKQFGSQSILASCLSFVSAIILVGCCFSVISQIDLLWNGFQRNSLCNVLHHSVSVSKLSVCVDVNVGVWVLCENILIARHSGQGKGEAKSKWWNVCREKTDMKPIVNH